MFFTVANSAFAGLSVIPVAFAIRLPRALATGRLERQIVFGSYVSDVPEPNDVDVILVMRGDCRSQNAPGESSVLFDHARANDELAASVFWIRPDMLLGEPLEQVLAFWQTKRDGRRRGVVEIQP